MIRPLSTWMHFKNRAKGVYFSVRTWQHKTDCTLGRVPLIWCRIYTLNRVIDAMSGLIEDETLRYDRMVEGALRGVVKQAVREVMAHGLPGDHHFYITFMTDYPGVRIPEYLRDRYPGEMTVVLQYQFSGLNVDDEKVEVTLSFNNQPEKLVIPLNAISIFADPSVNFALQFQPLGGGADEDDDDTGPDDEPPTGSKKKPETTANTGEVVSLDQFRKKK